MNATRIKTGPWSLLLAMLILAWSTPVMAQDDGQAPEQQQQEEAQRLPALDDDDPLYWAQMREIYTMQQRAFLKDGRFALSLYGGLIPNSIFEQYFPLGLRLNYYVMENIGIEVSSSYNFVRETRVNDILQDDTEEGSIGADPALIGDTQLSHTTAGIKWSPVYGKFAFYGDNLYYFDMYVFGGAGMVVARTEPSFGDTSIAPKFEGVIGVGAAVFTGEHLGLRLDYRQFLFAKVAGVGGVAHPGEISLGATWFF